MPKGSKKLKLALRQAALAIRNQKDTPLSDFFKRVAYKHGKAISPTARKLAVIIWNKITKKVPNHPPRSYPFIDQKRKMRLVKRIKKQIEKFELKPEYLCFCNKLKNST